MDVSPSLDEFLEAPKRLPRSGDYDKLGIVRVQEIVDENKCGHCDRHQDEEELPPAQGFKFRPLSSDARVRWGDLFLFFSVPQQRIGK